MTYTSMLDFYNEKGEIDWKAYRATQTANGERCYKCGSGIILHKGYRTLCGDCSEFIANNGETDHHNSVRCPKCRNEMKVHESELYELYEEGEHKICCQSCDFEFEVSTRIEYTFRSPEIIKEEEVKYDE